VKHPKPLDPGLRLEEEHMSRAAFRGTVFRAAPLVLSLAATAAPLLGGEAGHETEPIRYLGADGVSDSDYRDGYHDGRLRPAIGTQNYQILRANRSYPDRSDGTRHRAPAMRPARPLAASLVSLALAGPAWTQTRSPHDAVVKSESLFETAPFRSCHASTLAETPDGLVAAWFGGSREAAPDVGVWLSRQADGRWTAPVEVANGQFSGERYSVWNPVLFQPADGPLLLFYKTGDPWWGMLTTSGDGGRTWTAPRRLPDGILGPIKNKPVQLAGGTILAGSSTEDEHGWRVHLERSSDLGRTWAATPPLDAGDGIGAIQPTLLTHAGGRLQLLARTRSEHGFVAQSWSDDAGRTWSPLRPAALPNNNSGLDAVTLADGRQLLVYNHSTRNQPGMGHKGRGILNVAVSRDGVAWEAALILEHLDESGKQFSYPAVIQTGDGLVHLTYTWHRERIKHVVLDPARLVTTPMPSGEWPAAGPHSLAAFLQRAGR
jgi:predicted neuraminidase